MFRSLEAIKKAQAYDDPRVTQARNHLINQLDAELTEVAFEEGSGVDEAVDELTEAMAEVERESGEDEDEPIEDEEEGG
jgi:selenocysteine-specific translation elongation factor